MAAAGVGLADTLCRYHTQKAARHGSPWCPSITATALRTYVAVALAWIKQHRGETPVAYALIGLAGLLDSGRVEAAQNIKRRPATFRARVAFGRLKEAGVKPERLLATHMAVYALILDDLESHKVTEYRIVQVAKALHRLASGTHRRWDFPMSDGTTRPLSMHVYPKSSGLVLRVIGREVEEICMGVTESALQAVREEKARRYGPHPSRLPGWLPRHLRERRVMVG